MRSGECGSHLCMYPLSGRMYKNHFMCQLFRKCLSICLDGHFRGMVLIVDRKYIRVSAAYELYSQYSDTDKYKAVLKIT